MHFFCSPSQKKKETFLKRIIANYQRIFLKRIILNCSSIPPPPGPPRRPRCLPSGHRAPRRCLHGKDRHLCEHGGKGADHAPGHHAARYALTVFFFWNFIFTKWKFLGFLEKSKYFVFEWVLKLLSSGHHAPWYDWTVSFPENFLLIFWDFIFIKWKILDKKNLVGIWTKFWNYFCSDSIWSSLVRVHAFFSSKFC